MKGGGRSFLLLFPFPNPPQEGGERPKSQKVKATIGLPLPSWLDLKMRPDFRLHPRRRTPSIPCILECLLVRALPETPLSYPYWLDIRGGEELSRGCIGLPADCIEVVVVFPEQDRVQARPFLPPSPPSLSSDLLLPPSSKLLPVHVRSDSFISSPPSPPSVDERRVGRGSE